MVVRAGRQHPDIDFQVGDAESLKNHADGRFDAVGMNFGILHPDQAAKPGAIRCRAKPYPESRQRLSERWQVLPANAGHLVWAIKP